MKTEQTPTPGPWATGRWDGTCNKNHKHGDRDDPCVYDYVFDASQSDCVSAANLEVHREFVGMDELIACKDNLDDVRLIAAAPELLQSVNSLAEFIQYYSDKKITGDTQKEYEFERRFVMEQARNAIKKAAGEKS